MIRILRNVPIKRKLTIITMVTTTLALTLACVAFTIYDQVIVRRDLVRDLSSTAEMIGFNSASALSFDDPASAGETLESLAAHPHVIAACVYGRDGRVFATYRRPGADADPFPAAPASDMAKFGRNRLVLVRAINFDSEIIGAVYLRSNLDETRERMGLSAIIFVVVMLGAGMSGYGIASRLQRVISDPVSQLASVAGKVASGSNYAVRAVKQGNDEVGALIDGFNEMLAQIQMRDEKLQRAHDELEQRVEARTRELAASVSLLNATLDSTTDGIVATSHDGNVVCYNSRFAAMWNLSPDVLSRWKSSELTAAAATQVRDPDGFIRGLCERYKPNESHSVDLVELFDGRTFERYIHPQRVDGRDVGVVVSYRNITERKQAEAKLTETHKQLLDTSRQAGMAEVATGVLHNVGNVLNSVNVSTTLLTERVRHSKASNVAKLGELLAEKQSDLAGFLTNDPRGQKVPEFVQTLAECLRQERNDQLTELEALRKNIEHIKEIVAMQQSYARVSGMSERVAITELIEDAINMNTGAFARHDVNLVRDFQANPTLSTEKHKVLQILVNLMRNAKYACDDSGRTDKQVVLRVTTTESRARIVIADNGVGIPMENLARIFSHGFTTRKNGHGFGLHSGALAAKELGGTLLAESEGPGRGATFILELPLNPT
jgi:PAS domain S-box-containing protein